MLKPHVAAPKPRRSCIPIKISGEMKTIPAWPRKNRARRGRISQASSRRLKRALASCCKESEGGEAESELQSEEAGEAQGMHRAVKLSSCRHTICLQDFIPRAKLVLFEFGQLLSLQRLDLP